ncbi:MAG TPA: hypothetical protein ENK51_03615 [Gammaproteobacteria bacterium]|nr:hypothetical protein [Gammaproteobacteria bacterium]
MNNAPGSTSKQDPQALELTLHDGLDRLQEFTLMLAFQGGTSQSFEILSITPPTEPVETTPPPRRHAENVVCLQRALLKKIA